MSQQKVDRIAHCDWGAKNSKRAMCIANRTRDAWSIDNLCEAGETPTLLTRIRHGLNQSQRVVIGFDFPIGYPKAFGEKAGLGSFTDSLPNFGTGAWKHFFEKTDNADLVSIHRPFYPLTGKPKGSTSEERQSTSLGIQWSDLFRRCELRTSYRNQASPLFWTLGPQAVGTAAMCGWLEILQPLLADEKRVFKIWPFEGDLESILQQSFDAIVETYPGEAYSHIGFPKFWSGKTDQKKRRERAEDIFEWAAKNHISISPQIREMVADGFGTGTQGEDPFDAVIGLCSMISVINGVRTEGPDGIRTVDGIVNHEGWIFGQQDMPNAAVVRSRAQNAKTENNLRVGDESMRQGRISQVDLKPRSAERSSTTKISDSSNLSSSCSERPDPEKQVQTDAKSGIEKDQVEQIQMMQFIMELGDSPEPDGKYAYGDIARMNKPFLPGGAQAVGSRLSAICQHHLGNERSDHERCCFKVVNATTRQHNCQKFPSSQ